MNKLTKGSLATGAGLVLLLGGAGTFMSWNDSGVANGGQVTAGHLIVAETATGTWSSSISGSIANITAHEIVPGETLTYTAKLGVDAVGENLQVTTGLTGDSIVAATTAPEDVALAQAVAASAKPAVTTGTNFTETGAGTGVYDVAEGAGEVTVAATIEFPSTADGTTQDGQVNLTAMEVTLNQALATQ